LTAISIHTKIKSWLIQKNLYNKTIFYCSDAAANVSSEGNGVAGLLEKDLPLLKSHKCLCHLQNTALKHTYKQFPRLQNFNKDLGYVINFIDNSPKKLRILEDSQIKLEYKSIYQLLKAKEIGTLSHMLQIEFKFFILQFMIVLMNL